MLDSLMRGAYGRDSSIRGEAGEANGKNVGGDEVGTADPIRPDPAGSNRSIGRADEPVMLKAGGGVKTGSEDERGATDCLDDE